MSSKAHKNVVRAFDTEAEAAFRLLVDELDFIGPERDEFMLPSLVYHGHPLRYDVTLDTHEVEVAVTVWLLQEHARTSAQLTTLVTASGLGSGQHVFESAQTVAALHKAVSDQADWLRRLHPILVGEGGAELIERVGRRYNA